MRILLIVIIFVHGLLHLPGFIKAFGMAELPQLPHPISRVHGILWAVASLLFVTTAVMFLNYNKWWWMVSVVALILSQYLIISDWEDAGLGTALNIVILLVTIIGYGVWTFNQQYEREVNRQQKQNVSAPSQPLAWSDLAHLPDPVRIYLRNAGAVGQPRVHNFRVELVGALRSRTGAWMSFTSVQHNFMGTASRLFFMNSVMKRLPVAGYHCLKNGIASMDIRLFSLFRVQKASGEEMNKAETVTFFNDMCCLAPATLVDPRISWYDHGNQKVTAVFQHNAIAITADLFFNEHGELIDFVSNDRVALQENGTFQRMPWSTPLRLYDHRLGYCLPRYAEAVYHYPEGKFTYGRFEIMKVSYNVSRA